MTGKVRFVRDGAKKQLAVLDRVEVVIDRVMHLVRLNDNDARVQPLKMVFRVADLPRCFVLVRHRLNVAWPGVWGCTAPRSESCDYPRTKTLMQPEGTTTMQ
jgi:hypothetical protein